jgi:parvulin-like peptidyl-prolyl isomerase
MTFRARPAKGRGSSRDERGRRSLYMNLGFTLVIVAALGILVAAVAANALADRFGTVANVNGVGISREEYRARYEIEAWRLDRAESDLRDAFQAGRLTESERDAGISAVQQQRSALVTLTQERLIDVEFQRQLAEREGIEVTDPDIDARMLEEATDPEQRHVWVIEVAPEISEGADAPTAAQTAAAKEAADAALADLEGGKSWEEVARAASTSLTAPQAGDLGWFRKDNSLDAALNEALFAAEVDVPTDVIEGEDGIFRIGRVSEITPETVDAEYTQKIIDAGIALADYRRAAEADVRRQKLEDMVVAQVVDSPTEQRRVSEIYVGAPQGSGDEVKVSHILFSPNDNPDPTAIGELPEDDPAWIEAETAARAAYDELKPLVGTDELATKFAQLAREQSDEPGAETSGGDLPYFTRDQVDRAFGDAIFADGLESGDLLEPVKSQFGWHVILFEDRRPDPTSRIEDAKRRADAVDDFAAIAKEISEGPEAADGGVLGWIARTQLDQQLEDAIFATPVGSTSDVIEVAGDGFYLFKVWEEAMRTPDGDQADQLRRTAFSNWYQEEKSTATIDRAQVTDLPVVG